MKSKGFALIGTLFLLTLFALLCVGMFNKAKSMYESFGNELHSFIATQRAIYKTLSKIQTFSPTSPIQKIYCHLGEGEKGKTQIKRTFCERPNLTPPSLLKESIIDGRNIAPEFFPLFDYNTIFKNPSSCDLSQEEITSENILNRTSNSAYSNYTCKINKPTQAQKYVVHGNMLGIGSISLGSSSAETYALLAGTGYVKLEQLVLSQDSIIVAGGDLVINSITGIVPIFATLISGTGIVRVNNVNSSASLKLIGAKGVFGPATQGESQLLLPPISNTEVLGSATIAVR